MLGIGAVARHAAYPASTATTEPLQSDPALDTSQAGEARSIDHRADARLATEAARLRAIDQQVRAHEQAHASVGGAYTGAPQYTYERGPNGVQYAVAGEVSIDSSAIPGDPQATLEKMRTVIAAALAPVDPSTQDRHVAAIARQQAQQASLELARQTNGDTASATRGLNLDVEA